MAAGGLLATTCDLHLNGVCQERSTLKGEWLRILEIVDTRRVTPESGRPPPPPLDGHQGRKGERPPEARLS